MKGKATAVLFIIVFLLIVAVIFTFLTSMNRDEIVPEATPVPAAVVTPEPAPAVQTPEPTNTVIIHTTPAPAATETPTQDAPAATPAPTPAATPAAETAPFAVPETTGGTGVTLGSGSFRSSTGNNIDIRADWVAVTSGANQVDVTVTVYVESYAIHLSAVPNTVNISLNGQYASLGAPALDYDGGPLVSNQLASNTFTIECAENDSRNVGLQVEWHFNGSYGGVDIPVIECGGEFVVSR